MSLQHIRPTVPDPYLLSDKPYAPEHPWPNRVTLERRHYSFIPANRIRATEDLMHYMPNRLYIFKRIKVNTLSMADCHVRYLHAMLTEMLRPGLSLPDVQPYAVATVLRWEATFEGWVWNWTVRLGWPAEDQLNDQFKELGPEKEYPWTPLGIVRSRAALSVPEYLARAWFPSTPEEFKYIQ